ncbi:MAG: alpha/beta hydrolase-fold protein [Gemmataceae bacterium]
MTELTVQVPADTLPGDRVFVAADADRLGSWRADGIPLHRLHDGRYATRLTVDADERLHYLVTRGTWRTAEANSRGGEMAPRLLTGTSRHVEVRVAAWGRDSVRYHTEFPSRYLHNTRTVTVYLPPGYGSDSRRYPVFYMQDGQNLFDSSTAFAGNPWRADETAERLIRSGDIDPLIIVGIANTPQRLQEYGPTGRRSRGTSRSYRYGKFLVDEVKPFIDRTYRTMPDRDHTAIGGSSLGALISLFLCKWYPDVFGLCAAVSPSLWWDRELLLRKTTNDPSWTNRTRFWLDMGDQEGTTPAGKREQVRRARRFAELLVAAGREEGRDFRYLEVKDGHHNEHAWAARFDQVLKLLFRSSP